MSTRPGGLPRWFQVVVAAGVVGQLTLAGTSIAERYGEAPSSSRRREASTSAAARATPPALDAVVTAAPSVTATASVDTGSTAAITTLLEARAKALLGRDRAAYQATVDPADPAFLREQIRTFDNLRAVPLSTWTYDVDAGELEAISSDIEKKYAADEVYAPKVSLQYRLLDFDTEATDLVQRLTFARRGERWYVAGDSDFDRPGHATARAVWDFGPVDVIKTAQTLVLGPRGRRAYLQLIAREVEAAIPRVSAVWGKDWNQRVVVLVPTSQRQVSDLIGTRTALGHIAAVAVSQVSEESGSYRSVGIRVIINPPNFDKLTRLGKRVVLTHEVTHVASRSATSSNTPAWLVEGFADFVGYRGSGVAATVAAQELAQEIRRGKIPAVLATFADFDGDSPRLPQAYEGAWLACRMIADRWGEKTLVAFYRAMGASKGDTQAALEEAMTRLLNTTPEAFTADWRAYLQAKLS